ncbi:MAG TPA: hypothetical protein PKZ01_01655 [Candidatus Hydrogenedentes bacterium]|nr:hypothetical protein [Candidatus Hydrogenedentota bacterium]
MRRITSRTVTSGVLAVTALWLCGCAHSRGLHATKEREMTLGLVQRYVHEGMSAVEVLEALGSPNMVRRDSEGRESWVYDKVATETSHSESDTGVSGQVSGPEWRRIRFCWAPSAVAITAVPGPPPPPKKPLP